MLPKKKMKPYVKRKPVIADFVHSGNEIQEVPVEAGENAAYVATSFRTAIASDYRYTGKLRVSYRRGRVFLVRL